MVEDLVLDRAFGALADPTRRALLVALRDGDARISDLARPLPMTFAGVSRHVGVLEAAGLVRREQDPKDRRVVKIEVTPEGTKILQAARARRVAALAISLEGLGEGDVRTLERAVELLENLASR